MKTVQDEEPPIWVGEPAPPAPPRVRRLRPPRRPAVGFAALIMLGLLAAFFSWVSAEPLWLSVGHGQRGTATVTHCSAHDVPYECVHFTTADGEHTVADVSLLGTNQERLEPGTSVPARMVSVHSGRAYAADAAGLNLRWAVGILLVLLCGLGIAWATGVSRLDGQGVRRRAFLACLGAPLLLTLGFLAATW